ncbi:DNA mismatch repair protein MutS [Halobacteria archaeon AArc-curdl1]|uniref:DNA mismatch repair protein MutS n=1 Tax=Natronosalvus hydrolyticus TaxID=2979988 RepID=A0AAP2Z5Y7_9EURY|nr:DNA mismatch repair protein MutS [Halobacteria archaeon AArc-curdl1]
MDAALGPPSAMAEKRDELTPMMAQYHDLCATYDDAIVLFQVGDFYETFCGAAETTARLLELTLTSREDSTGEYPMTGVPVDSAASYIESLLEAGFRVAIADQIEEPGESAGVVERAVTRVITPGTITEDELLSADDNNFVAALTAENGRIGLALLDVSTGDFLVTSATNRNRIADEISRFRPTEIILGPNAPSSLTPDACMVTPFDEGAFAHEAATDVLTSYFGSPESLVSSDVEIRACGALLTYAEYVRGGVDVTESDSATGTEADTGSERTRLEYLTRLRRYDPQEYLLLDAVAVRSLELFEPRTVRGQDEATLIGVLDETASALGGRRLRDWLRRPLLDADRIEARLEAVDELTHDPRRRNTIQESMRAVYDLERLIGRISRERANARDLRSLHDTLAVVPDVRDALEGVEADRLQTILEALDPLEDVRECIERSIVADPPHEITEGGIIADGYDDTLDELRATKRDGKQWIDDLEARERERTGVSSLKVGHNSVHGYYIEVTNPNLDAVPEEYQRRQTLKRAERFVTPDLKSREDEIVGATHRADEREYDLFCTVRETVGSEVERVQDLADALAALDALCSLATVAAEREYCKPTILERDRSNDGSSHLEIEAGRHPVVERTQSSFVPNDAVFDSDTRLSIITGPNMSGKSTYMRQVAQITLLAQMGSFVPAERVRLTPFDRIFTRVGASDDIAGGRSTFMIEMEELSTVLREADEQSLVLLDEVGRGTSTADGLAIAQAITEHIHDEIGAIALFATHHHPLTELASELEAAETFQFEATDVDGEIEFNHSLKRGTADGSYGVEVATAAGVPEPVLERSQELAGTGTDNERNEEAGDGERLVDSQVVGTRMSSDGGDDPTDVAAELRALDLAHLTPVEALTELDRLKRLLEE